MSKRYVMWQAFSVLLSGLLLFQAHAEQVSSLYETEVGVAGQSRDERSTALKQAFAEILTRISGRADIQNMPQVADQLGRASRYLQQYRYQKSEQPLTISGSGKLTQQVLWVRFNEKAVNQLLYSLHLPVWGTNRPSVLVWLVVDDGKQRRLIDNDSDHIARSLMQGFAIQRGLPLHFPLLDLTDRRSLQVSDVWANFEDRILAASERYQAEAVLVGRVYQAGSGNWSARWNLYQAGMRNNWEAIEDRLSDNLASGVDKTTDFLAQRFAQAQPEGSNGTLLLKVKNVTGLAQYHLVRNYLTSITAITQVRPYRVTSDDVSFELSVRSGQRAVEQTIALGSTLVKDASDVPPLPEAGASNQVIESRPELVYRLIQ